MVPRGLPAGPDAMDARTRGSDVLAAGRGSQGVNESGVAERVATMPPIKTQSAALARATADIYNGKLGDWGDQKGASDLFTGLQSSMEALHRLPQSRARSMSRRSRLVGRPSCKAVAGSGARRRNSWAFSRVAMLSAVSS